MKLLILIKILANFDFSTNAPKLANPTLISALLDRIYFKKSLSIEAKYKEEIEKIEQEISTDCLYLKENEYQLFYQLM